MINKIEYKDAIELSYEYAEINDKFMIYEYKEAYCQNTFYDNIGFFNCHNFEELCEIVYEYLKMNGHYKYDIELETCFENHEMEFRVDSCYYIKIINCKLDKNISFLGKDDVFFKFMKNKNIKIHGL